MTGPSVFTLLAEVQRVAGSRFSASCQGRDVVLSPARGADPWRLFESVGAVFSQCAFDPLAGLTSAQPRIAVSRGAVSSALHSRRQK